MSLNRDKFHARLKEVVPEVIYNASENDHLKYPCITYKPSYGNSKFASNKTYINDVAYEVTLLTDKHTDDDILIKKMLEEFTLINFQNQFVEGGIAHAVFVIYNTL